MTISRDALIEHLKLFEELGVTGYSKDPAWAARQESRESQESGESKESRESEESRESAESRTGRGPSTALGTGSPATGPASPGHETASESSVATLAAIREDIGDCTRCKLCRLGRKQIVFGVGSPTADLMFVGEAPGRDEDIQGIPFVGRAGQKLTQIIEAIGLKRDDVYIANVIKCRPPENRNPEPDEVAQCEPFLFRQVDTIKPKVIVALGTFAARSLLKTMDPISRLRGRLYDYRGAKLVPTFHPAYLLRNPGCRREVWEDMKKVRALLNGETVA
jgi:DNA polymerase